MRSLSLLGLLCAVLLLSGCGTKTHPVRGRVVFDDGTPANELAGYMINFQSTEHQTSANGIVQPDGTFTVGTLSDGDGAMLGRQRVAVTRPAAIGDERDPPWLIAETYGNFDKSGLAVDIASGKNDVTIKVERLKK